MTTHSAAANWFGGEHAWRLTEELSRGDGLVFLSASNVLSISSAIVLVYFFTFSVGSWGSNVGATLILFFSYQHLENFSTPFHPGWSLEMTSVVTAAAVVTNQTSVLLFTVGAIFSFTHQPSPLFQVSPVWMIKYSSTVTPEYRLWSSSIPSTPASLWPTRTASGQGDGTYSDLVSCQDGD